MSKAWYIDRGINVGSIFRKDYYSKLVTVSESQTANDIIEYLELPTSGNPNATLTYLRDLGFLKANNDLTEFFRVCLESKISNQIITLLVMMKRNSFKEEANTVKPFVVIAKALKVMNEMGYDSTLTWNICAKYLMPVKQYSEINEDMLEKAIADTSEANAMSVLDIWFNALVFTGLFEGNAQKITLKNEYIDFIKFIAEFGHEILPCISKDDYAMQADDSKHGIYFLAKQHPFDAILGLAKLPELSQYLKTVSKYDDSLVSSAHVQTTTLDEPKIVFSDFLSKEWFKEMANNYPEFDERANELIATFNEKFNPDILEKLSGLELLNKVFLNPDNPDNLCRALEFNPELTEFFGSIKGGNSYKYGLFYSSNGMWMTGSHQKPRELTQDEAINIGTEIRDRLVAGARVISSYGPVKDIGDYKKLYKLLEEVTNGDINKVWFMKYYQMLYPELFAPNYSDYAQRIVLGSLGIEKEKYPLVRMGQIRFFANECELSNVLFSKIFWDNYEEPVVEEETSNDSQITFNTGYESKFARNRILFGAPGTGKSFTLNGDRKEILYGDREADEDAIDLSQYGEYERVTFHPDYSYANFVGTYKPVPCNDDSDKDGITYEYVPGPFMRTYVKALLNSKTETPKPYLLIIEEINRANVAAVFGDVFQLLDRDEDEVSEYPIQASEDMKKYLAKKLGGDPKDYEEIRIPDNMFIWATMNSADQGVFPMDTAFKRRWDFKYLGIDDSEKGIKGKTVVLGAKTDKQDYRRVVEWNELRKAINEELLKYKVNEDKLMGPYFISKKNLPEGNVIDPEEFSRIFKNKVIMYLFDDAAKQKRATLFEGCEEKSRNQYSKICNEFDEKGVLIFGSSISDEFTVIPEDDEQ